MQDIDIIEDEGEEDEMVKPHEFDMMRSKSIKSNSSNMPKDPYKHVCKKNVPKSNLGLAGIKKKKVITKLQNGNKIHHMKT